MQPRREDSWLRAQTRSAALTRVIVIFTIIMLIEMPLFFLFSWKLAHLSLAVSLGLVLVSLAICIAAVIRGTRRVLMRYHD